MALFQFYFRQHVEITVDEHGFVIDEPNSMLKLIQHLECHQPKTAEKVLAALDVNVPALTEPHILAAAREWFDDHKNG